MSLLVFLVPIAVSSSENQITYAPRIHVKEGTSTNWAGYAVLTNLAAPQKGAVTDVKGSWVVPFVDCVSTPSAYSSFWVGIDGYSSNTVEQTGTDSDCSSGTARYYAWYEMYPKFPFNLKMKISPGDVMSAEVAYIGNGKFRLVITDTTTGAIFSTTQTSKNAAKSSAEWIAEAPSSSGGVLPLANFGTASFNSAYATLNGVTASINSPNWQNDAINMTTQSGILKAQTSVLSPDGTNFSVSWQHS